jgi:hypothetical protein
MAEIAVVGAGPDDEAVVAERPTVVESQQSALGVQTLRLAEQDRRVVLLPEDRPEWLGDLAGRQSARRDLVEKRREEMVVPPIDEGHADAGVLAELPSRVQAGEPTADDQHAMRGGRRGRWLGGHRLSIVGTGLPFGPDPGLRALRRRDCAVLPIRGVRGVGRQPIAGSDVSRSRGRTSAGRGVGRQPVAATASAPPDAGRSWTWSRSSG